MKNPETLFIEALRGLVEGAFADLALPTRTIAGSLVAFAVGYAHRDGLSRDDLRFLVEVALDNTSPPPVGLPS